jgi:hypothetical protein
MSSDVTVDLSLEETDAILAAIEVLLEAITGGVKPPVAEDVSDPLETAVARRRRRVAELEGSSRHLSVVSGGGDDG